MSRDQPIRTVLHCPRCHLQHIDEPDPEHGWLNPPHKSHLCADCGLIWRPADVPTCGVRRVKTHGDRDDLMWPTAVVLAPKPRDARRDTLSVYESADGSHLLVDDGNFVVNGMWYLTIDEGGVGHRGDHAFYLVGYVECTRYATFPGYGAVLRAFAKERDLHVREALDTYLEHVKWSDSDAAPERALRELRDAAAVVDEGFIPYAVGIKHLFRTWCTAAKSAEYYLWSNVRSGHRDGDARCKALLHLHHVLEGHKPPYR